MSKARIAMVVAVVLVGGLLAFLFWPSAADDQEGVDRYAAERPLVDAIVAKVDADLRARNVDGLIDALRAGSPDVDASEAKAKIDQGYELCGQIVLISPGLIQFSQVKERTVARISRTIQGSTGSAFLHLDCIDNAGWKLSGIQFEAGMLPVVSPRAPAR